MTSSSQTFHDSKTSSHTILSTQKPQNQVMPNDPNSLRTVTPQSSGNGMQVNAFLGHAIIDMCTPMQRETPSKRVHLRKASIEERMMQRDGNNHDGCEVSSGLM